MNLGTSDASPRTPTRTLTRCLVCGFAELRTDEVVDRGVVFLAECPRCEHRFTSDRPIRPIAEAARPIAEAPRAPQRVRPAPAAEEWVAAGADAA